MLPTAVLPRIPWTEVVGFDLVINTCHTSLATSCKSKQLSSVKDFPNGAKDKNYLQMGMMTVRLTTKRVRLHT